MTPTEREAFIDTLQARYAEKLRALLVQNPRTLDDIEQAVEDLSREMDRELEEALLERQEHPTRPAENQAACPQCRGQARYRSTEARQLVTRHGEYSLLRRRYYCARCRCGFAPLDRQLGLDRGETSRQIRQWVALLAPWEAFGTGTRLLRELTGVPLGESTFTRIAVQVGSALRQAEQLAAQRYQAGWRPTVERKPQRLYVSVDGIFAPYRDPWKKDGSAGALQCRYGEVKVATVYEPVPAPEGDQGAAWRAYTATSGEVKEFAPLLAWLAHRAGAAFAQELVFLADGQAYNWTLAAALFPTAVQIVDYRHVQEHLRLLIETFLGPSSAAGKEWVQAREAELFADQGGAVQAAIADLPAQTDAQRQAQQRELGYFTTNAERMRYGTFRHHGYQLGTGVMEAGCKQVVHQRLDQVGMHWRIEQAEAILALRAAQLSDTYTDLRKYCVLPC